MKFAKLIVICFTLCLAVALALPHVANASTKYVRVIQDDVPLYTNAEIKKVTCLLEKSYYLTVIEEIDDFYKVEIMGGDKLFPKIVGYVQRQLVEQENLQPVAPLYPTVSVTVQTSSASVYFSPLTSSDILVVATNTQQMSYYGKVIDQVTTWYYVYFNGYFGYVDSANVTTPKIPLHPTPLPQPVTPPTTTPPSNESNQQIPEQSTRSGRNEILLIAFAAILATALTCALFLPKTKENGTSFYTDNR